MDYGMVRFWEESAMNQAIHQLLQLILQGITWALRTIETIWVWSWSQIMSVFNMSWGSLPGWKLATGVIAIAVLIALLAVMFKRGVEAFSTIAAAFWTMTLTAFSFITFVVAAGLLSRGFQWVVTTVPDRFWEKFI